MYSEVATAYIATRMRDFCSVHSYTVIVLIIYAELYHSSTFLGCFLICRKTCMYKYLSIQSRHIRTLICTKLIFTIPLLYNTLFVQNLNLQDLVCSKLELTTPCLYNTCTYNTLFVQNLGTKSLKTEGGTLE